MEILDIVNENDEVIGQEDRKVIHREGLLHREIHVWIVTPDGKIIFQKRGMHKDTYPGLLDATVGGHVDLGESYEDAAIRETQEETGLSLYQSDLKFIKKEFSKSFDSITGMKNHKFSSIYTYLFPDDLAKLKLEDAGALGFESFSIEKLKNLSDEEKKMFIPRFLTEEYLEFFETIV